MPRSHAASLGREIRTIRRSVSVISGSSSRLLALLIAVPAHGKPSAMRKLRLSPARRATLKLQGRYMGHLRNLKPGQKARVKALKSAKGFLPAITLAKKLSQR